MQTELTEGLQHLMRNPVEMETLFADMNDLILNSLLCLSGKINCSLFNQQSYILLKKHKHTFMSTDQINISHILTINQFTF